MDINKIVNIAGVILITLFTIWLHKANKRDKNRKQKNGTNK